MFCCKKNEKKLKIVSKLCSVTFAKIKKTTENVQCFNINYVKILRKKHIFAQI